MATGKTLCSTCQKAAGIFTCCGCQHNFCSQHVAEHRQELNKQMDELTTKHDQLQQTITEQKWQPDCHPLIKRVDQWEQESIEKIRQAADDARKQLLPMLEKYRMQVSINDLTPLTNDLKKARDENDYVETDLNEWRKQLDKLTADLHSARIINFRENCDEMSIVPRYIIDEVSVDRFHETFGDVRITTQGRCLTHGPTNEFASSRGYLEYSSGQHRIRFRIDRLSSNSYFACGIMSKNSTLDSIFSVLSIHPTGANRMINFNYQNSVRFQTSQNYAFQMNATYELLIDCDKSQIRMTNQQANYENTLEVSLQTHPFPWQFFITLSNRNDSVVLG